MKCFAAFVGVSPQVVEAVAYEHGREGSHAEILWSREAGNALVVVGQNETTLVSWRTGEAVNAAFGSSVQQLGTEGVAKALDRVAAESRLPSEASDFVSTTISNDAGITAITGSGPHRLFWRRLPGGGLCLSNHLASVVRAEHPAMVDRSVEDFLLGFGFVPDDRTMFQGIKTLPPMSTWTSEGAQLRHLRREPSELGVEPRTGSDLIDLLLAVTEARTADVDHVGVFLGGLDSALVCALLKRLGKDVTGFTFDVGDPALNQSNIDLVQGALGIDHVWVPITPERMAEALVGLTSRINSPSAQPHYQLHTLFGSEEMVSRGVELALSGDGCDALFLGYPTIKRRSVIAGRAARIPNWFAWGALKGLGVPLAERKFGHVARVARSVLHAGMLPGPARGHLPTQYLDEFSLRRLRKSGTPVCKEAVIDARVRLASGLEGLDSVRLAFAGNSATGASRNKVDGAVMRTGVAQWSPYQEPSVADYVAGVESEDLEIASRAVRTLGKAPLIAAARSEGLLPVEVITQAKESPVSSPIDSWYANELRSTVMHLLEEGLPFDWNRDYVHELLAPKWAEDWYRRRIALSPHVFQAIGILVSYAAFSKMSR